MSFRDRVRERTSAFFTNWANPDYGLLEKIGLTFRNRARALAHGCCGNHGQPGC